MKNESKKIVNFEDRKKYKEYENGIKENQIEEFDEACRKVKEFLANNYMDSIDKKMERRIIELEEENKLMRRKIKNSFPLHILLYLTICSFVIGISLTLLGLRFMFRIYTFDPYYIICALLISLTLFFTAITAIKDWKDYLNE